MSNPNPYGTDNSQDELSKRDSPRDIHTPATRTARTHTSRNNRGDEISGFEAARIVLRPVVWLIYGTVVLFGILAVLLGIG